MLSGARVDISDIPAVAMADDIPNAYIVNRSAEYLLSISIEAIHPMKRCTLRTVLLLVLFLLPLSILHAQDQAPTAVDSIRLTAGEWLTGEINSYDQKAVYLLDGRIVMYRVIAEIRTGRDSLAFGFQSFFPHSAVAGSRGSWTIQPDTARILPPPEETGRLFRSPAVL